MQNVSDCYPIFITPEGFVRFHPIANPNRLDINITLTIRAWDGSSQHTVCASEISNDSEYL